MICPVCGNKIEQPPEKVVYCPFCGAELGSKGIMSNKSTQISNQIQPPIQTSNPIPPQRPSPQIPADDISSTIRPAFSATLPNQRYSRIMQSPFPNLSPYAPFGQRFFAFLIDLFFIWLFTYFTSSFFLPNLFIDMNAYLDAYSIIDPNTAAEAELIALMNTGFGLLGRLEFFNWVVSTIYFVLFTIIFRGRTPGKAILKLVVVDQTTLLPVTHIGKIIVDNLTRRPVFMVIDLFFGALASPGPRNQYRITQKLSKLAVIKSSMVGTIDTSAEPTINPQF